MGFLQLIDNFVPSEIRDPASIVGPIVGAGASALLNSGGGSGGGTATHTNPTIPRWIRDPLSQNVARATDVSHQPFVSYPADQQIASMSQDERMAQQLIEQFGGQYQPVFDQSINTTNSLLGQAMAGPSSGQIQNLMNPFLDQVLRRQEVEAGRTRDLNLLSAGDKAGASNAFGGSRQAVLEGQVMNDYQRNLLNTQAQTEYDAYGNALNQYNTGLQQSFQGAAQLGNQGAQAQNALGEYANQLNAVGQNERGIDQATRSADFSEFLRSQGWDEAKTNYLQNLLIPTGNLATGNVTNSSITQPSNSMAGNILGGGLAGLSLTGSGSKIGGAINNFFSSYPGQYGGYGSSNNYGANGMTSGQWTNFLSSYAKGGQVKKFDEGGMTTPTGFGGPFGGRGTSSTINFAGEQVPWAPLVPNTNSPYSFGNLMSSAIASGNAGGGNSGGFQPGWWQNATPPVTPPASGGGTTSPVDTPASPWTTNNGFPTYEQFRLLQGSARTGVPPRRAYTNYLIGLGGTEANRSHNWKAGVPGVRYAEGGPTTVFANGGMVNLAQGGCVVTTKKQNQKNYFDKMAQESKNKRVKKMADGGLTLSDLEYSTSEETPVDLSSSGDLLHSLIRNSDFNYTPPEDKPTSSGLDSLGVNMPLLELGLSMMGKQGSFGDKVGAAAEVLKDLRKQESLRTKSSQYTPMQGKDGQWYNYDKTKGTLTPIDVDLKEKSTGAGAAFKSKIQEYVNAYGVDEKGAIDMITQGKGTVYEKKKKDLMDAGYSEADAAQMAMGSVKKGQELKDGVVSNRVGAVDAAAELKAAEADASGANTTVVTTPTGVYTVDKTTSKPTAIVDDQGNQIGGSDFLAEISDDTTGEDVVKQVLKTHPEQAANVEAAKALAQGKKRMTGATGKTGAVQLALARKINPDIGEDAFTTRQDFDKNTPQSAGGQTRSLIKLMGHKQAWMDLQEALKNKGDNQYWSKFKNKYKEVMGAEAPNNAEVAAQLLAGEAIKYTTGLGTGEDRDALQRKMSTALSKKQYQGVGDTLEEFAMRQAEGLDQGWQAAGLPKDEWRTDYLNKDTKAAYERHLNRKNSGSSGSSGQVDIPKDAAMRLKSKPWEAAKFDAAFGQGASEYILKEWKP